MEEVGRMIGYDSIAPTAPSLPVGVAPQDPHRLFLRAVRAQIAAQGFTEVYNYSFLSEEDVRRLRFRSGRSRRRHESHRVRSVADARSRCCLEFARICSKTASASIRSGCSRSAARFTSRRPALPVEIPTSCRCRFSRGTTARRDCSKLKRAAECLMPGAEVGPLRRALLRASRACG